MNLENNLIPYQGYGNSFSANNTENDSVVDDSPSLGNDLPISNLYESETENQFTKLHLPCKYIICSHLAPRDYGILASVNKTFHTLVFPVIAPSENNPYPNYRGFFCITLVRKFLSDELPGKLFGTVMNVANNQRLENIIFDPNDLVDVNKKIRLFFSPLITQMSNVYANKIFDKQSVSNKDLMEMCQLTNNPVFTKLFNLAFDIVLDAAPAMIDEFNDEELAANMEAFNQEITADLQAVLEKAKAKKEAATLELQTENLEQKEEKVSRFANIHFELKNKVAEVDPIPDYVPVPVPVIAPVGVLSSLFAKVNQFVLDNLVPAIAVASMGTIIQGIRVYNKFSMFNGTNCTNI